MSKTKRRTLTLALAAVVLCGSAGVGYADIFGIGDAAIVALLQQIEATLVANEGADQGTWQGDQQANQLLWREIHRESEKTKLQQFLDHMKEMVEEHQFFQRAVIGKWEDPMSLLRDERSRIIALGTETRKLTWEQRVHSAVLDQAREASERLRQIMDEGAAAEGPTLRDSLEDLYEPANNTRTGGRSEAALREMAEAASFIGQVNQQLKEQFKIIDEAYKKAQEGGLAGDEVARLGVVAQTAMARAQGLSQQAQVRAMRLQMTQLGYQVAAANERDRARLNEQEAAASSVYLFKPVPGVPMLGDFQTAPAVPPE